MITEREPETSDDAFDALLREVARAPVVRLVDLDLAGRTIGRYDVRSRIGAGGMGVVYEAWDTRLRRAVALKVLRAWRGDGHAERLMAEARRAAALSHPNIASVFDVDTIDGVTFMALELVEGRSLKAVLAHDGVDPETALRIARRIASALARAHLAGIVHRDITPSNVMIGAGGAIKVLDFGIATADTTSAGCATGTPGYQSPEQVAGGPVDSRTDVYAFGVLLREMIASRPPSRSALARSLSRVAARCSARRPADRPRDGAAVAALLRAMPRARASAEGLVVAAAAGVASVGLFAAAMQGWMAPRGSAPARAASVPADEVITSVRVERASPRAPEPGPRAFDPRAVKDEIELESKPDEAQEPARATPADEAMLAQSAGALDATMTPLPITAGVDPEGRLIAIADLRVLDARRDRAAGRAHFTAPTASPSANASPSAIAPGVVPQQLEGKVTVSTGQDGLMRVVIDLRPPPSSDGGSFQLGAEDGPAGDEGPTATLLLDGGPSAIRPPAGTVSKVAFDPQTAGDGGTLLAQGTGSRAAALGSWLTTELCEVPASSSLIITMDEMGNVRVVGIADETGDGPQLFAIIDGFGIVEAHHGIVSCLDDLGY